MAPNLPESSRITIRNIRLSLHIYEVTRAPPSGGGAVEEYYNTAYIDTLGEYLQRRSGPYQYKTKAEGVRAIAFHDRKKEIENGKRVADESIIESIGYDDDSEEILVLSDFEDSADDAYRESRGANASVHSIAGSSEDEEDRSDDREYRENSWGANENEGSFGSDVNESVSADESGRVINNNDEEIVMSIMHSIDNPKRKEKVRKRKVQSRIEKSDL
ncbi:hypothetical protein B0O99DRAFT_686874 [Bisporella sp. PMI_857]|nr:hypothetical protein B0O99DRAFT_686874 [Bisporella sp. PMI_857]